MSQPLFLFVDEAGNFDFSRHGTKYFILTVLSTTNPVAIATPLLDLRYQLLPYHSGGESMEEGGYFHASEDAQSVRDSVFGRLLKVHDHVRVDAVIAQKNKANPAFYDHPVKLYMTLGEAALKYALNRAEWGGVDHVVIVFSSVFDRKKRGILKQAFKSLIKLEAKLTFAIYFHDSKFDLCNQAVDYLGWAIYRKWEKGDVRSYDSVKHMVRSEFSIFEKGTTLYYPYEA